MKRVLWLLALLPAMAWADAQGPYGVFGGPISSANLESAYPATSAMNGTFAFTTDMGLMEVVDGEWEQFTGLSGTPALPNGTTATTQTTGDNTTKIATDAFVLANASSSGVSSAAAGAGIVVSGTGSGPYTGAITVAVTTGTDPQTGTTYTIASGDNTKVVTRTNASSCSDTLPQAGTTGFTAGFSFTYKVLASSTVSCVLTPTTSTINGKSSYTLPPNTDLSIAVDGSGSNYIAIGTGVLATSWLNAASSGTSVTPICAPGQPVTTTTITATGNLSIAAPTGCTEGQRVLLKITYTGSITYTWTGYHANSSGPGALPTSSGSSSGVDFFTFYTDVANSHFDYLAGAQAF